MSCDEFVEKYSEHMHDVWAADRLTGNWSYDPIFNDQTKQHPLIKPYNQFNDREKDVYRLNIKGRVKNCIMTMP